MPLLLSFLFFSFPSKSANWLRALAVLLRFPNTCWRKAGEQGSVSSSEIREGPSAGTAKWRLPSRARLAAAEAAPGRGAGHRAGLARGQRLSRTGRSRGGAGAACPGALEPRTPAAQCPLSARAPAWEPLRGRLPLPPQRAQPRAAGTRGRA